MSGIKQVPCDKRLLHLHADYYFIFLSFLSFGLKSKSQRNESTGNNSLFTATRRRLEHQQRTGLCVRLLGSPFMCYARSR